MVGRPAGPPPDTHRLGRSLARGCGAARDAGLDDESIESLPRVTLRAVEEEEIAASCDPDPRVTSRYRNVTALTACTITVPEGRISALIGPNGAGKTTGRGC